MPRAPPPVRARVPAAGRPSRAAPRTGSPSPGSTLRQCRPRARRRRTPERAAQRQRAAHPAAGARLELHVPTELHDVGLEVRVQVEAGKRRQGARLSARPLLVLLVSHVELTAPAPADGELEAERARIEAREA